MSIMSWDRFVGQKQGDFQYTIDASELRLGDLVVGVENSAPELELSEQGLQIDSFERKQWLQQRCSRVVVDLDRSLHRQRPAESSGRILLEPVPAVPKDIEALCRRPLSARMLVDAWRVYREISQCAQAAVVAFSRHGELDIDSMQAAVAARSGRGTRRGRPDPRPGRAFHHLPHRHETCPITQQQQPPMQVRTLITRDGSTPGLLALRANHRGQKPDLKACPTIFAQP